MAYIKQEPNIDDIDLLNANIENLINEADACLNSIQTRRLSNIDSANNNPIPNSYDAAEHSPEASGSSNATVDEHQDSNENVLPRASTVPLSPARPEINSSDSDSTQPYTVELEDTAIDDSRSSNIIMPSSNVTPPNIAMHSSEASTPNPANQNLVGYVDLSTLSTPNAEIVILSSDEESYRSPLVRRRQRRQLRSMPHTVSPDDFIDLSTTPRRTVITRPFFLPQWPHSARIARAAAAPAVAAVPVPVPVPVATKPSKIPESLDDSTGPAVLLTCPICYESLANRPALSTICGHIFCTVCLKAAQRITKKCPICKKPITRAAQMHPIFFNTA